MDTNSVCDEVCSTKIPRKSTTSSTRSCSATERCRQELEDYDVEFDVRPPSGTNHQQPGKHLSIDTRFSELSLENSSFIAESERDQSRLPRSATSRSFSRNKIRPSRVQIPKGNFYITSPFKQGPEKDVKGPVLVVDPSLDLKQRTIAGVTKVKQQLDKTKRARNLILTPAHLQRGHLRSLGRPVTASGPLMNNCQGIMAGARRYHGFARRQTSSSLERVKSSRVFSTSDTALSAVARPGSPSQLLRPESSIHNTSCASSVDECNRDSDCSFSEDESVSEDSIDAGDQDGHATDCSKGEDHPEEMLLCSSTGNQGDSRLSTGCKPYVDHSVTEHPDDDTDKEEGRWARHNPRSGDCSYGVGGIRGNETDCGQKTSDGTTNNSEGKRTRLTKSGDRETEGISNYELQNDLVADPLNISSMKKSHQKAGDRLPFGSRQEDSQQGVDESFSSHSCLNADKVIDVHIRVVSGKEQVCREIDGSYKNFDDDDYHGSDALDSNRIPSADIFKVLDTLNLSTSAMKPPTPRGEKSKLRRVQSAGYTRQTAAAFRDKKPLEKGTKGSRPPSSKGAGKRKEKDKDLHKPANLNQATTTPTRRAEDLTKHVRETLPGYFTEQYRKILDEQNRDGKNTTEVKTDRSPSNSLALVAKEMTDQNSDQNGKIATIANSKTGKQFVEIPSVDSTSERTKSFSEKPGKSSRYKKSSRSSLTSVFVTMEDKSEVRSVHDLEDCSSGVETMSCVTDSSSYMYGDTMNKSNYSTDLGCSSNYENLYSEPNNRQPFHDVDEFSDRIIDDEDDGVDVAFFDDFDDDSTDLEVVARPMPLSESRYVTKKKPFAPFPPLCFSVNAKPPDGQLYYFAYGPEMNPNRMAIYLRREPKTRLWGILFGFQLRFNKRGTSVEAGGFPNVEFNPGHSVEGCVYAITNTELTMLDNCMGYPKHYTRVVLPVWMLNCTSPSEHGVAQYCVPAALYIAQDEWVTKDSCQKLDCRYSVGQCLKASDILTPNYVQFLTSQTTS